MKEGWRYIDFKDVFPVKMGKTPPRGDKSSWDEKRETHNKWVSIADISNNEGKIIEDTKEYISDDAAKKINKVSKGSLLMSFKLSIGRMAFAGDDLYTNEAIIAIPESNKYILRFIYFYFLSYNWLSLTEGNEKVKGATLNKSSIGKIQLPILPLSDQQQIVERMDAAFAKIDALKANAQKQLNEAKALFQASLKEMLEPKEGWEEKTLGEVSEIKGEYGLNVSSKPFDGIRYLRITDITDGGDLNSDKVSASVVDGKTQDELKEGDILFARTGATVGKTLVYRKDFGECLFAGYLIRYRINKDVMPRFIHYFTHSAPYYSWVAVNQEAAAQPNISAKKYNNLKIFYPSLSEQQQIVERLDALSAHVKELEENQKKIIAECDALKQAMLREVFSEE